MFFHGRFFEHLFIREGLMASSVTPQTDSAARARGSAPLMPRIAAHRVLMVLIVLACATSAYKLSHRPSPAGFQMPSIATTNSAAAMTTGFVSTAQNIATHAASLIEVNGGRVRAFWYASSREGAGDVEIRSAVFDGKHWSKERSVIDREHTQRALLRYVKKLGNPVAARAPDGAIWLYFVTVSLGGWAGSSLTTMSSRADANAYARSVQRNQCEGDRCGYEFSYPYLIQTHNGDFHLAYTWNRSFIKHVQFNRAWLDARMKESDAALH